MAINAYTYGADNPISFSDPTGREIEEYSWQTRAIEAWWADIQAARRAQDLAAARKTALIAGATVAAYAFALYELWTSFPDDDKWHPTFAGGGVGVRG